MVVTKELKEYKGSEDQKGIILKLTKKDNSIH